MRYIEKLEGEREKFFERMLTQSHQIGLLEKENEQLQHLIEAPKPDASRVDKTPTENEREAEFIELNPQLEEVF